MQTASAELYVSPQAFTFNAVYATIIINKYYYSGVNTVKHAEIQNRYKNHIFLSYRETGGSRSLTGDVIVIVFFVNDSCSQWTEAAKNNYIAKHVSAMRILVNSAYKANVQLEIRNAYADLQVDMDCTLDNYSEWSKRIISQYRNENILEFQKYYKEKYGCKECPVIFAFNKPFRDYSVSTNTKTQKYDELSVVSSDSGERTIIHELLHQFGARDLYFPQELREMIVKMGYLSIMSADSSFCFDSLTSYLIGWSDEIDNSGVRILETMKHYTYKTLTEAVRKEWGRVGQVYPNQP